jgi:DTW domain-containing protein YfiP
MKKQFIDIDDRVAMCPECMAEKAQCTCGTELPFISMSRRTFEIFQAMEDHNVPGPAVVNFGKYVDTEILKSAGW